MQKALVIVSMLALSCSSHKEDKIVPDTNKIDVPNQKLDCEFELIFRNHIADIQKKNISEVAKVFTFPMHDPNIWYVIHFSSGEEDYDTKAPFTYVDLKENFDKLFSKDLLQGLGDLDINQLFSTGAFQTQEYSYNEDNMKVMYKLQSTYDKAKHTVELSLVYEFLEDGETYESRITYPYEFSGCTLQLKKMLIFG